MLISFNEQEVSCHSDSCTVISLTLQLPEDCFASHTSITNCIWFFLPLELPLSYSTYSRTFVLSVQFIISFLNQFGRFIFDIWLPNPFHSTSILLHGFYFKMRSKFKFLTLKMFLFIQFLITNSFCIK